MDSSSSSSSSSPAHRPRHRASTSAATQLAVADRIVRALHHPLLLLHRSESDFFVLGATGNVYTVSLSTAPVCTCPDRMTPCKHILFVLIQVLGVSPEDTCLKRRTLRPCLLSRLLSSPASLASLAGPHLRDAFHRLRYSTATPGLSSEQFGHEDDKMRIEQEATCPVCLEEIEADDDNHRRKVVARCSTCRNLIHEECLSQWKRSRGRRAASCVICRARWRDLRKRNPNHHYLNLAAYLGGTQEDDDDAQSGTGLGGLSPGGTTGRFCGAG